MYHTHTGAFLPQFILLHDPCQIRRTNAYISVPKFIQIQRVLAFFHLKTFTGNTYLITAREKSLLVFLFQQLYLFVIRIFIHQKIADLILTDLMIRLRLFPFLLIFLFQRLKNCRDFLPLNRF